MLVVELDIWRILPIRNSYLVVGVNLEGYYSRLSQTRRRIILNYSIIMALVLFGIYVIFKLQETYIVKKTLNEMSSPQLPDAHTSFSVPIKKVKIKVPTIIPSPVPKK